MNAETATSLVFGLGKILVEAIGALHRKDYKRVEEIIGPELQTSIARREAEAAAAEKFGRREDPTAPFARAGLKGAGHD